MVQVLWVKVQVQLNFGLQDKIDFQIGTLSKAIGVVVVMQQALNN